jgi:hypothetical protein
MLGDVDVLIGNEARFEPLGQHCGGRKAPDQLQSALAALINAALVGDDGAEDVPETTPLNIPGNAVRPLSRRPGGT